MCLIKNVFSSILLNSLLVSFIALSAHAGATSSGGIPNPATSNCTKLGGQSVTVESSEGGQVGLCQFNRAVIAQWTLYRATKLKQHSLATQKFLSRDMSAPTTPNPASAYCTHVGGKSEVRFGAGGAQFSICRFSDRSGIGEWTLFLGPDAEGNQKLAEILEEVI